MRYLTLSSVVALLAAMILVPTLSFAQEDSSTGPAVSTIELDSEATSETDVDVVSDAMVDEGETSLEETSMVDVVGEDETGSMSSEEYEELVAEAEEVTEADVEAEEVIVGTVIAINEEEETVVLETPEGELLVVAQSVLTRNGGRGRLLNPSVSDTIVLAAAGTESIPAEIEITEVAAGVTERQVVLFIAVEGEREQVVLTDSTPVYRNGQPIAVTNLQATDDIRVIRSDTGEVLAIEASSTDESVDLASGPEDVVTPEAEDTLSREDIPLLWILLGGAVVVVILGLLLFRRK